MLQTHGWMAKAVVYATLLMCSACASERAKPTAAVEPTTQLAAINWNDAIAPTTMSRTNNAFLIMMR